MHYSLFIKFGLVSFLKVNVAIDEEKKNPTKLNIQVSDKRIKEKMAHHGAGVNGKTTS